MPKIQFLIAATAAALCVAGSGCVKYQSKPLSSAAVERALTPPDDHALRLAAADLHHPILRPVAIDPTRGLTPDDVAVLAVVANPDLRAERDQRAVAGAQVLQAGLLPNPQLTGGVDLPYNSSPPDNFTAYNAGVNWDVTSLITRDAKRRAAAAEAASVELDIAWKEWQTAEAARLAAFDVLALQEQLAAAREADEHLAANLGIVRRAVERHEKTLLDLSAAETASRDAHSAYLALESSLVHQRLVLNRAIGLPSDAAISLRSAGGLPQGLVPPADLSPDLESRRLDLVALKRGYESQDETLRAAILGQFPKINLGFNVARDTTNVHTVGFGVGIDIPIFDRNQGVIASESATRQKLFDEYVSRLFAARADLATVEEDIRSTNALIADADAAIPALENLVHTYEAAMQHGNVDILSYYTALATLDQKRIDRVKLKQQLVENWVALEIASGRYLPLGASPATRESKQ